MTAALQSLPLEQSQIRAATYGAGALGWGRSASALFGTRGPSQFSDYAAREKTRSHIHASAEGKSRTGQARPNESTVGNMESQSTNARAILPRAGRGTMAHSQRRNLYAEKSHHSSALPPLTTQELTKEVQCIVLQFRTTEVVEDTQASLRAIENVRNGESGMSLKTFVNLCRANPRARALAGPLLGYGDESDPNVVQAISVLLNQLVRPEEEAPQVDIEAPSLFGER